MRSVVDPMKTELGPVAVRLDEPFTVALIVDELLVSVTGPVVFTVPKMLLPDKATVPLPAETVPGFTELRVEVSVTLPVVVTEVVDIEPGAVAVKVLPVIVPSVIAPTVFATETVPVPAFSARPEALIWFVALRLMAPPLVAIEIAEGEATFWIVGALRVTAPPAVVMPAPRSSRLGTALLRARGSGRAGAV